MDPELVKLLLQLGQFTATENVPEELKALIEQLATYAVPGGGAESEPPEGMPAAMGQGQPSDPNQPPAQAACPPGQPNRAAASRSTAPTRVASRGLTESDVQRMIREGEERRALITANADRPGMTPELATFLGGQPLGTVRNILGRLAPKPAVGDTAARARTEPAGVPARPIPAPGSTGGTPPAPPAGTPPTGIDPKDTKAIGEAWALARLPKIMGANPAHVENVRARMAAGQPVGVLAPARQAEVRALRAPS